eukprot:CAMPEP_0168763302 /NCGR_PEP_ID=MMETSP0724-20121128/24287_1 /TAXON_ID=265536 /ORGANISM="Amphiprora sp., Strain CCMP467" /LENGTH=339 /DNA_ID=CAMNT_0008812489 /DNA_START=70 /DNA_END=1086 /DNA_ORIENTATION=+
MRFKATLAHEQLSLLHSLISPISRLTVGGGANAGGQSDSSLLRNGCMLYLDAENVRISLHGKGTSDCTGIACFAELKSRGGIFMEHRIESVAQNNAILLEIDIVQLRMALQSITQEKYQRKAHSRTKRKYDQDHSSNTLHDLTPSTTTIIKLAKRNNTPCLCLIHGGTSGGYIEIQHAIPVRVAKASEMQQYLPPELELPNVQLELDRILPLRAILERLKGISSTLYVTGNPNGQLILSTDGNGDSSGVGCSIRTVFDRLTPRMEACRPDASGACTVKVDSKKLAMCLQWQQQTALVSTASMCLVENESLVLHAMLNPPDVGFFTYYIPVHFLSDNPAD